MGRLEKEIARALATGVSWKQAVLNSTYDLMDAWYNAPYTPEPLPEYLGLTLKEYALFVESPEEFVTYIRNKVECNNGNA